VATASHSHTVQLIRSSGDAICLKIVTPRRRALDRPRLSQQPRLSTASKSGPTNSRARHRTNGGNDARQQRQLPTARSMPDLTAAEGDHTRSNDGRSQKDAVHDSRDRVLYELTNQLRPSPLLRQRQHHGSPSATQQSDDVEQSQSRQHATTAGQSTSPLLRRPVPPPRGTSLSGRIQPSAVVVNSLSALRAKSAGSELKKLLAASGHSGTPSRTASHEEDSVTAVRSTISGEHLILPSQLKKLQRSPSNDLTLKAKKADENVNDGAVTLNGHGCNGTPNHQAIVGPRSPSAPKRPAPPPPSTGKMTSLPPTNGEVNFLVMAEQARRQYILSKQLARGTRAASKAADTSSNSPVNEHCKSAASDRGAQKAANGVENSTATNGGMHFVVNRCDSVEVHESNERHTEATSSPYTVGTGSRAGQTAEHAVDANGDTAQQSNSPVQRRNETSESWPTEQAPAIPPKRRSPVELRSQKTVKVERPEMTSQVAENGSDEVALLQSRMSTDEVSGAKSSKNIAVDASEETRDLRPPESNSRGRKSNAKLIRGKNVVIRRSAASRSPTDDCSSNIGQHPWKHAREAADRVQQLMSVFDVGVLPPPPDFAD